MSIITSVFSVLKVSIASTIELSIALSTIIRIINRAEPTQKPINNAVPNATIASSLFFLNLVI